MNNFFSPEPFSPCGAFTVQHILAIIVCILGISLGIYLTSKYLKNIDHFLIVIAIIAVFLEIIKVVWGTIVHRYNSIIDYIPLWFCSLFVPSSVCAAIKNDKIRKFGLSFLYYGGIIGGIAYLFFPTTSLYKFPLFHFLSIHSMFYHSLMIYTGFVIIIKKTLIPSIKDAYPYLIYTTIACILAYIVNVINGSNLMFLNRPSNNFILSLVQKIFKKFYPVVITIAQNFGTFFFSFGVYKLISKIKSK